MKKTTNIINLSDYRAKKDGVKQVSKTLSTTKQSSNAITSRHLQSRRE